jgi:hypothetical protein
MPSSGLDSPGLPAATHTAKEYGPYHLPQPAVWADPGDTIPADPERDLAIQQEAELLLEQISESEFPTDSEEYRNQWDAAVAHSDQLFRQRYGGWIWMVHHVQAHHLAAARQADAP